MFCPKCGKKNVDGAKFCEFCGAEIKSEEKVILPKKTRKKMSKKHIVIIAIVIALVLVLGIGGTLLSNNFKPSSVAIKYFLAVMDDDTDEIYDFINIPKNEFTSKEIFEKVSKDDSSDLDLVNYEVTSEEVSSDGLSAQVKISYTVEGRQTPLTTTIYLVKNSKNKFLIFDDWKISDGSSLVRENYKIQTFKGSTLKLEGIEVDEKYLEDDDDSNYDTYVIPALFKGEYDVSITLANGLKASSKLEVSNSNSSFSDFELDKDETKDLEEAIKNNISKLYDEAINHKEFSEIKSDFEYDDADLSDLEDSYDKFELYISNAGLREYNLKDINIDEITVTEEGYLYVTIDVEYDYKVKAFLSDEELEKSDDDTCYLTFDYNGDFKLVDISSLAMTFSRF